MFTVALVAYTAFACSAALVFSILNFREGRALRREREKVVTVTPRDLQGLLRADSYRTARPKPLAEVLDGPALGQDYMGMPRRTA